MTWLRRKSDRLRPLDEAAAYARCHGDRDDTVRIVNLRQEGPGRDPAHHGGDKIVCRERTIIASIDATALLRFAGQVVTRKMLCEHLWEGEWEGVTNVIEVHVKIGRAHV